MENTVNNKSMTRRELLHKLCGLQAELSAVVFAVRVCHETEKQVCDRVQGINNSLEGITDQLYGDLVIDCNGIKKD